MRSALVSILIVLQHAAQLPCRSVTRSAPSSPLTSIEDLDSIIARNKEITDLLIPLLEANLANKRQEKRGDLLKVFPYRDSKIRKDPVVEILPLSKRQARERKPLALILASELRSRSKKGRNKVHAQKAFIIQNEENVSNFGEDFDFLNEHGDNKSIVQVSDDDVVLGIQNENQQLESSGDGSSDDEYDFGKSQNLKIESSEENDDLSEEIEDNTTKEYLEEMKFRPQFVESYSDESDDTQSSESDSKEAELSISEDIIDTDEETDTPQLVESVEPQTILSNMDENSVESTSDYNSSKYNQPQKDQSETDEGTQELDGDITKKHKDRERQYIKPTREYFFNSNSSEDQNNYYNDEHDAPFQWPSSHEENRSYKVNSPSQWNDEYESDEINGSGLGYRSDEDYAQYEDVSGNNEYQEEYNSKGYESESNGDVYDSQNYDEEIDSRYNDTPSTDDIDSDNEANESHSKSGADDTYSDSGVNVEHSDNGEDDSYSDNGAHDTYSDNEADDTYSDNGADDNSYSSAENRNAPDEEGNEKDLTFSDEIAQKYATDPKYSVENDDSLIEASGELGKFNVESVEGLLEVLKQDDEDKSQCNDRTKDAVEAGSDHSHEIHKTYKLSFKFNK